MLALNSTRILFILVSLGNFVLFLVRLAAAPNLERQQQTEKDILLSIEIC